MNENNSAKEILKVIKKSNHPVCIIDSRFDYDAFGAAIAMADMIESNFNKKLRLVWTSTLPKTGQDILDTSKVEDKFVYSKKEMTAHDLLISLDSGNKDHIWGVKFKLPKNVLHLNIDHHESNPLYGDLNYVDKNSVSTCRILYELFAKWKVSVSKQAKKALMVGLITDSGFFQFQKTNSKDFKMMAELLNAGIDMYSMIWKLTFNDTVEDMLEKAIIYNNLKINFKDRYAYSSITLKDMKKKGLKTLRGLIPASDIIKKLVGVDYVFVVKEKEGTPGKFNVSLRAHIPDFDVSSIAKKLGGGGHKPAAATGLLEGVSTVEDAVKVIVSTVKKLC